MIEYVRYVISTTSVKNQQQKYYHKLKRNQSTKTWPHKHKKKGIQQKAYPNNSKIVINLLNDDKYMQHKEKFGEVDYIVW